MRFEPEAIGAAFQSALREFMTEADLKKGHLVVLGCSTSEICGNRIGTSSNSDYGRALITAALPIMAEAGVFFAVQCCEHLNRALVVEEAAEEKYHLQRVSVIPVDKAGGACAAAAYRMFAAPVVVESIAAHAGLDIGDTAIGMHVIPVQVPLRLSVKTIGHAALTCLKHRPKFIGGERAQYTL